MAGDTDNPRVWVNADVLTAPLNSTPPDDIDTPWDAAFETLGLLSEDGMVEARTESVNDKYAYGGILVRTTRSKHKRTIKVTALENNPVVYDLVDPGSTAESTAGVTTRTVVVPQPNRRMFGIETIDGDIVRRRVIASGEVIEVGNITTSDEEIEMFELTINIYPDADGVLYTDITNDPQAEIGS